MSLLGTILLYLHYSISVFHLAVFLFLLFYTDFQFFLCFPWVSLLLSLSMTCSLSACTCVIMFIAIFPLPTAQTFMFFSFFFQPQDLGNFIMLLLSFHIIRSECWDTHPHTHTHRHIYNLIAFSHAAQTKSCECRQMPLGGKITLCEKRVQQSEIAVCDLKC